MTLMKLIHSDSAGPQTGLKKLSSQYFTTTARANIESHLVVYGPLEKLLSA